ncbi:MAG: DUF485 domain-containing protein [Chromatiales bacterium]
MQRHTQALHVNDLYRSISRHPLFKELETRRGRLSWVLTCIVLLAYFAFILTVAFAPHLLALPVREGSPITWGIPAGLLLIVLSFALTGVYVHRSNSEFDPLTNRLLATVLEQKADGNG